MLSKRIWIGLLIFFAHFSLKGQSQIRFYADSAELQSAFNLLPAAHGEFWLGGHRLAIGQQNLQAWLYRLNTDGNILQRYYVPFPGYQTWVGMARLNQNQIAFVVGQLNQGITENWLGIMQPSGLVSFRKISGLDNAILDDVAITRSGKLILCGFRSSQSVTGNDFLAALIQPETALPLWIYEEHLTQNDHFKSFFETGSGDLLFCGDVQQSSYNPYVARLDSNGLLVWDRILVSDWNDGSQKVMEDSQGRIWVVGESSTEAGPYFDTQLSVLSGSGQLELQTWLGSSGQDAAFALFPHQSDGFWIGGYSNAASPGQPVSPFVMHMNAQGASLGECFWPQTVPTLVYDMHIAGDSLFYFCGVANNSAYFLQAKNPPLSPVFVVSSQKALKSDLNSGFVFFSEAEVMGTDGKKKKQLFNVDLQGIRRNLSSGIYFVSGKAIDGKSIRPFKLLVD